ncbi:hypothetical protein [Oerskovia gallyi]|uniref:Uncharacterized protein n=1 Tax=Oerskovia gallyi TaxID=2762226 RepID=A0ABR8V062_9CELL|nr:hypothetical protein [Oerskovia gallyi]MBD7998149.1 hypothetical protein [Oerskovia gallyi]
MTKPAADLPFSRPRTLRTAVAVLLALVCLVGTALPGHALPGTSAPTETRPTLAQAPAAESTEPTPTILVAVAGLYWRDISRTATPTLWSMIRTGSVASLVAGRTACTTDAWLTLSAGQMVSTADAPASAPTNEPGEPGEDGEDGAVDPAVTGCPELPQPVAASGDLEGPATIPGWATLTQQPDDVTAQHPAGAVAQRLADVDVCATAVGPGAAVMLADGAGHVSRYVSGIDQIPAGDLQSCPVTVIDQGELFDSTGRRGESLEALDATLRRIVKEADLGTRVLIAGVSAGPVGEPGPQVVVDWRPEVVTGTWLHSPSTQTDGIVQLVDVSATIVHEAGGSTEGLDGAPISLGETRRMDVSRTVENRQYFNVLTSTIPSLYPVLVGLLIAALVVTLGGLLWVRRAAQRRGSPTPVPPGRVGRRVTTAVLVVVASAPVGASLASLSRWWVWSAPNAAATLALTAATVLVAVVAWSCSRLLPRRPWALPTALGGVTWLVLTIDGATGTTLQQASLLGTSAVVDFTRFYGFNNVTFAVYAVAGLVLAGGLASAAVERGRRRLAAALVAAVGTVTVVIDGWPGFGADFGGILALVPAFAVLALLVGKVRLTLLRIAVVAGATVLVVAVISVIDWLSPTGSSHLGGFVQSLLDGGAFEVIARKAAGAWKTIANPGGVLATVLVVGLSIVLLRPERWRLPEVAAAYRAWPLLKPTAIALVVVAGVGSVLNDSGIIIGIMVFVVGAAMLVPGFMTDDLAPADAGSTGRPDGDARAVLTTAEALAAPGVRRMPTMVATIGGGLFVVILLASSVLSAAGVRSPHATVPAGTEVAPSRSDVVAADQPLVVVGTAGVTWEDVSSGSAPTLNDMLTDGAGAAGVSQPTGAAGRCVAGGWLALSAGQLAEVTTQRGADGSWACPDLTPVVSGDGAQVSGWDDLVALQRGSTYQARLGVLGDALTTTCATAVGPGAAAALATSDGAVPRYRDAAGAFAPGTDTFACPLTVVDAGDATVPPLDPTRSAAEQSADRAAARTERLRAVDERVRTVLDRAPSGATVLVVDVSGNPGARPVLGVALARPTTDGPDQARFLTSAATRTDGVARLLDVPATILSAAGVTPPPRIQDTPLAWGSVRAPDAATTASSLADLTSRDHVRRTVYSFFVDVPLYAGLALGVACLALAPVASRARSARARARWARAWVWARGAALVVAAVPTAAFLTSLTGWWRFANPTLAIVLSTVGATAIVAALGALAPRRPAWLAPGIVAGITFVALSLDAMIGTPLNRASPLGSAPTFGARFYGFGNPTFSVYAVAALVLAAALAQWLVLRHRRVAAAVTVGVIGVVTMAIDVWPTWGADLGGGLVLVPAFAVLGLAASGARVTWRRFFAVAAVGVAAVAAVGVLDWLRPPDQRSHLGRFVAQAVDGSAWETLARKAGYALRSVLGGVPVWLTILVLVAAALLLFGSRRFTPRWFARTEAAWPLLRPALLALWIVSVAGSVVNDFGVRIAMIALIPAIPLLTVAALHASAFPGEDPEPSEASTADVPVGAAPARPTAPHDAPDDGAAPPDAAEPAASGR